MACEPGALLFPYPSPVYEYVSELSQLSASCLLTSLGEISPLCLASILIWMHFTIKRTKKSALISIVGVIFPKLSQIL